MTSERAIIQRAQEMARSDPCSLLHKYAAPSDQITLEAIAQAAEAGDQTMQQVILDTGRYVGYALAQLTGVLSVRHIVLAGSVTCFGKTWLEAACREMAKRSLALVAGEVKVGISRMEQAILLLGASAPLLASESGLFAPIAS